jgi:hypothetical protein
LELKEITSTTITTTTTIITTGIVTMTAIVRTGIATNRHCDVRGVGRLVAGDSAFFFSCVSERILAQLNYVAAKEGRLKKVGGTLREKRAARMLNRERNLSNVC